MRPPAPSAPGRRGRATGSFLGGPGYRPPRCAGLTTSARRLATPLSPPPLAPSYTLGSAPLGLPARLLHSSGTRGPLKNDLRFQVSPSRLPPRLLPLANPRDPSVPRRRSFRPCEGSRPLFRPPPPRHPPHPLLFSAFASPGPDVCGRPSVGRHVARRPRPSGVTCPAVSAVRRTPSLPWSRSPGGSRSTATGGSRPSSKSSYWTRGCPPTSNWRSKCCSGLPGRSWAPRSPSSP